MFYCFYLGEQGGLATWKSKIEAHRTWLGQEAEYLFFPNRFCTMGLALIGKQNENMLTIKDRKTEFLLILDNTWSDRTPGRRHNGVEVRFSKQEKNMTIQMPLSTPEQCCYVQIDQEFHFSNDQRLLARLSSNELNESAIFHFFENGCLPPDQSVFKHLKRLPAHHKLIVSENALSLARVPESWDADNRFPYPSETKVDKRLDEILQTLPRETKVYFSGGVDSSLFAAKLKSYGRDDVLLENYSFSKYDPEAAFAKEMAEHIGLPFRQMIYDEQKIPDVLVKAGKDYSFPFADQATLQTRLMVEESLSGSSPFPVAIDGTGADCLFVKQHQIDRWRTAYKVPPSLRKTVAAGYQLAAVHKSDPKHGTPLRVFKKSTLGPLVYAMTMMRNCLDGLAFHVPASVRNDLIASFQETSLSLVASLPLNDQVAVVRAFVKATGLSAAKVHDPLHIHGVQALYPFLDREMIGISASVPLDEKFSKGEQKLILKRMLKRYVPGEFVYRPKSGFLPPFKQILTQPEVVELIESKVVHDSNPLLPYVNVPVVKQLFGKAYKGEVLSFDVHNFLWSFMFLTFWVTQVNQGLEQRAGGLLGEDTVLEMGGFR